MHVWPSKTPFEELTYGLAWSRVIGSATISSAVWSISPDDDQLVAVTEGIDALTKTTLVKLGGGVLGTTYVVTCRLTDSAGEKYERDAHIKIIDVKPP